MIKGLTEKLHNIYIYIYIYRFSSSIKLTRAFHAIVTASFATLLVFSYIFLNPTDNVITTTIANITGGDKGVHAVDNEVATSGTPLPSLVTLNIDLTHPNASVELTPHDNNGTFASSSASSSAEFNVSTNNYTGYTLSLASSTNNDDGSLTNTDTNITTNNTLSSISTITTESDFSSTSSTNLNNKWGYKPSKYNGSDNTSFIPAPSITNPTTSSAILDTTSTYNTTTSGEPITTETSISDINTNTYTIGLGARVDSTVATGSYEGTFVLQVVGNPVPVTITYTDTSGDNTVTSTLPSIYHGEVSDTEAPISTTIPTRTGYTFKSWCLGTVTAGTSSNNYVDTCTGTTYNPSTTENTQYIGVDLTHSNTMTLVAMWERNKYLQTVQVRYQGTDGIYGTYSTYATCTADVYYGDTHSCSIAATTEYQAASLASYTVTGANTKQIDVDRKTVTVTLTKGTGVSSVSASGTGVITNTTYTVYYGGDITITATMNSGYDWVNWTGSATYTNRTQSISNVTSNLSFTANGKVSCQTSISGTMQAFDPSKLCSNVTSGTLTDARGDNQTYEVAKLADGKWWMLENLRLGGTSTIALSNSNTNMTASSWTLPAGVTSGMDVYYSAKINVASKDTTQPLAVGQSGTGKIGVYYNYCAATVRTYCYASGAGTGDANPNNDICPKNWRMPTGGSSGEYQALYAAYSSSDANFAAALKTPLSGHFDSSLALGQGSRGLFWSSTRKDGSNMYILYVYTSGVIPQLDNFRNSGVSVRCLFK